MADEQVQRAVTQAPNYALIRYLKGAVDGASMLTDGDKRISAKNCLRANIQVVPGATGAGEANPVIKVVFWSEGAGKFLEAHTALDFTAKGDGVSWETSVEVNGRDFFVHVVSGVPAGKELRIYGSGFDQEVR